MGDDYTKKQLGSLAITAFVVAITISGIYAWFWNDSKQLNHQISRSYEDRIETLNQQLQQRNSHEQDMLNRYQNLLDGHNEIVAAKTSLESNLAAATTKLEYLQENLANHQMGDWERKYLEEKSSNDQIFETMARLEEEIEQLKDMQETLETERIEHTEQITALKSELATATKLSNKIKEQPPAVVKQEKTPVKESTSDYRSARMISLLKNINGLPSQKKLNILVKVIPTVPDGVTNNELTELVSGMRSNDILSLIKSSEQHIQKTKDKQSFSLLLSKMNDADADAALKLLIN
ncbi:MAG: hypothetical protein KAI15_08065 [Gammaproteobacteria bacterium]|nr:hypothetical protein [Gammaproteobacteria bacterium]